MRHNVPTKLVVFGVCVLAAVVSSRAATIEGSVKGSDGRAAAGSQIRLDRQDVRHGPIVLTTGSNGRYSAHQIAEGTYNVSVVTGGNQRSYVNNVRMRDNVPLRLEFDLRPSTAAKKVKQFVWVPNYTGTHLGGRWVDPESEPELLMSKVDRKAGTYLLELQRRDRPRHSRL